ncbi:MAG TPA: tRNA (guanosine(37)-N1)-methyltransferase TrmD [Nitrospinota bacterium]|nr:tRNA (guanosine(37)-N1)-methyltransferase TrmD [Nitrospinota bacterium]|tara:strand:+ start:165672 stop:166403 length:732 start_codon:yes stop_codon:yes gene_type:complete
MRFDVITTFPQMFKGPMDESILKRAKNTGKIQIYIHDLRDWTNDKHRITDDYPYGGGPGMVMKVEPVAKAVEQLKRETTGSKVALMTPQGNPFNHTVALELMNLSGMIIICGRYEGVDERIRQNYCDMEISIGDFVLTGGEIPAMAIIDALTRLKPGVLGSDKSTSEESHSCGLLEYPQYTRPADYDGLTVPDVLLSGNHAEITAWRRSQSIERTAIRRPDLLKKSNLSNEELDRIINKYDKP